MAGTPWESSDANKPRQGRTSVLSSSLYCFDCPGLDNQFVPRLYVMHCKAYVIVEQSRPDNRCVVFPRMVPSDIYLGCVLFFATTLFIEESFGKNICVFNVD